MGTQPSFGYTVEPPAGWQRADTVFSSEGQHIAVRMYYANDSANLASLPAINVVVLYMDARTIDDFTVRNIRYMQEKDPGVQILEQGDMEFDEGAG